MPTILSDSDVFGPDTAAPAAPKGKAPISAAPPPSPLAAPPAGTILSHDDVFGKGAPKGKVAAPSARQPRSEASIVAGGVGAATKAVGRTIADFGDMLLSTPGMAMGTAADVASRIQSLFEGVEPHAAGRIAGGVREGVTSTFSPTILRDLTEKVISATSPDKKKLSSTDVQKGMKILDQGLKEGGKAVERLTGGLISAETFDSLVQEGMAVGGVKGATALAKGVTPKEGAPSPRPAVEETPSATQAKRDVKADVEKATGVRQTGKAAETAQKARRADARAAFANDPEYADYLKNYAEEEARQRASKVPQSAPGGVPGAGPRTARTGSTDAVAEKTLPPGRTPPVETGAKSTLDSALSKVKSGKSFDLTPEERVQLRGIASEHGRATFVDEAGKPINQKGSATVDMMKLIAGLGLGTGLAAYAYYHKDSDFGFAALGISGMLAGDRTALSSAMRDSGYTLKTLERLNQNATTHTREQVLQHLNRDDVSKSEKELVEKVLGDKKEISSKDLVEGFQREAKKLELKPKETTDYADYGLDAIDRQPVGAPDHDWMQDMVREHGAEEAQRMARAEREGLVEDGYADARTTIYQSDILADSEGYNHFNDPKYFAHTRSFDEDGVRHVVEVQSDVAQHAKVLSPEARIKAQATYDNHVRIAQAVEDAHTSINRQGATTTNELRALEKYEKVFDPDILPDVKLRLGGVIWDYFTRTKIEPPFDTLTEREAKNGNLEEVYEETKRMLARAAKSDPAGKADQTYMKQISEALAGAFYRETRLATRRASEALVQLSDALPADIQPVLKTWYKRVIREEISQTPNTPVRFATADTVAKVEGWPSMNPHRIAVDSVRRLVSQLDREEMGLATYKEVAEGALRRAADEQQRTFMRNAQKAEIAQREQSLKRTRDMLADAKKALASAVDKEEFSKEHQSIYNRYKSEIEKFLRNEFKAKPYTDDKGHTWLEVPPQPKGPVKMFGRSDPASLAALAAFVGGALAMQAWSKDPSLISDVIAGLLASSATRIRPRALAEAYKSMKAAKPLESIGQAAIVRESNMRRNGLEAANTVLRITKLVKDEKRREAVHKALDTGNTKGLSSAELAAYKDLKEQYAKLAQMGLDADVLKVARINYATHIWKMDADKFEELFGKRRGFGTSPNTPYSLERVFNTLEEGERAGLTPVSKDAAFVYAVYANSLSGAIENARILKTVKAQKTEAGDYLMLPTKEAPHAYVRIENPQLRGMSVHPEIASQMRFIFENPSASGITSAMEIIADVSKRSAVSASMFHTKALIDALIGATPGTAKNFAHAALAAGAIYTTAQVFDKDHAGRDAALAATAGFVGPRLRSYINGRNLFLKEMAKGSNSALINRAIDSGLVFGSEKGLLEVDDAGRRFYDAMKLVQTEVDRITSPVGIKGGKAVEKYIEANHMMDGVLWGRIHPGMKLETWSKTSDSLIQASIERNKANPKVRVLSQPEADAIAANFTNDTFGGLNWTRLAMGAKTRIGRMVAQELFSPRGRQALRIGMFAPDWTVSTARAALMAIDKDLVNPLKWGNVAKGMFQPISRGDLARQYIARSAMYYLIVGDAINYSMSGHHLWQNKDPTFIDWGDGRRMLFSKHIMEVPHWFDHPAKQALGKMGYVPKEAANQMLGTEYLAPQEGKQGQVFAGPRMKDKSLMGRAKHAASGFTPIPFQGEVGDATVWGFAGMPLYGKTVAQKEAAKRLREERKRKERK